MTVLYEGRHAGEYIVDELSVELSRANITVLSGQSLKAGHVIGSVSTLAAAATAGASNVGDGAMGAITAAWPASPGLYLLEVTATASNAGAFRVSRDGNLIGTGNVASAFAAGGLSFTLADGATDFAVGDRFVIAVTATAVKWREWNPANTDGSQVARGILFDAVDASATDTPGVAHVATMKFNSSEVTWFSGATDSQKSLAYSQLAMAGIYAS